MSNPNTKIEKYLQANYSKIDLDDIYDFSDLSLIKEELEDKEIFLTGENHGVYANEKLRMKFFMYFKEKTDFIYYIWELPFSVTYFLNIFLKTGNIEILKKVYKPLKGTFAWNQDSFNHWRKLYKFNKNLPKNKKIKIIGIDIEHQPKSALHYLNYVSPQNPPCKIKKTIKAVRLLDQKTKCDETNLINFFKQLKKDLKEKEDIYRSYLKENFFGFKIVSDNLLARYEVYHGNNFNDTRDKKMYKNFMKIYNKLPKGKFYGQLGLSHIFQRKTPYVNWFGSYLNKKFKGKVLSIAYLYDKCKYLYPTDIKNYISNITTLAPKESAFNKYTKNLCTLFKLNGKDSPFNKKLLWPIAHKSPGNGVTSDYFQYVIIIKGLKAAKPL